MGGIRRVSRYYVDATPPSRGGEDESGEGTASTYEENMKRIKQSHVGEIVDATPSSRGGEDESGEGTASTRGTMQLNYFDPKDSVGHLRGGNLPHWRQDGAVYFVTWRTVDSMPKERVEQWIAEREVWLKQHPQPHDPTERAEYDLLFPTRWERWLDECHGECLLARPDLAELVRRPLLHLEGQSYRLHEWVIMPNHVHVLVSLLGSHTLSEIIKAWKAVSAHAINKALRRSGGFWQKESFDHIVRSADEMERIRSYILGQGVDETPSSRVRTDESGEGTASTGEARGESNRAPLATS